MALQIVAEFRGNDRHAGNVGGLEVERFRAAHRIAPRFPDLARLLDAMPALCAAAVKLHAISSARW
jgi:hypothetical protein